MPEMKRKAKKKALERLLVEERFYLRLHLSKQLVKILLRANLAVVELCHGYGKATADGGTQEM